jgi:5'-3' exonuclease
MARILLVDHLNQIFSYYHQNSANITFEYLSRLRKIAAESKIDKIILCCDFGRSAFRTKIHPGYKGDRYAEREKQTAEEKRKLKLFLDEASNFQSIAGAFGMETLSFFGCEADDQIGALVQLTDTSKHQLCILSTDGDLHGLLKTNVVQGSMMYRKSAEGPAKTKGWICASAFREYYGIEPWQWYHVKALAGDRGDSIYSPQGLGKETALKMIKPNVSELKSNIKGLRGTVVEELKSNFEQIRTNYRLVNLLHTPEVIDEIFPAEAQKKMLDVISRFDEKPMLDKDRIEEWSFETGQLSVVLDYENWVAPFVGNGG